MKKIINNKTPRIKRMGNIPIPKKRGEIKTIVPGDLPARRCNGTMQARKTISSVNGP